MTADERKSIKERIDKLIIRTKKKIASMESMTQPIAPENSIGRISRMDAINNKSVMEAALRTARKELEGLIWAEKNLNHEDYGKCTSCKRAINIKRLMLIPGSKKCVKCA